MPDINELRRQVLMKRVAEKRAQESSGGEKWSGWESFARGAVAGASLDADDELIGAGRGMLDDAKALFSGQNANNGKVPIRNEFGEVSNGSELTGNYEKYRDEQRQRKKAAKEQNPDAYFAGELTGGLGSMAVAPGASAVKGIGTAARIGNAALKGAGVGAFQGYAGSDADDREGLTKDALVGAGIGAGGGAAFQGGAEALKRSKVVNYLREKFTPQEVAKKVGKAFLGAPEEATERYMKRPDLVNAARPRREITADMTKSLEGSKRRIVEGSQKSRQILEEELPSVEGYEIQRELKKVSQPIKRRMEGIQDDPERLAALMDLESRQNQLLGKTISGNRVKDMVQSLRKGANYDLGSGKFAKPDEYIMGDAAKQVDSYLKRMSPGYADEMQKVSGDTAAHKELTDLFQTDKGLDNLFKRVQKDRSFGDVERLKAYDERFGTNYVDQLKDSYAREAFDKGSTQGSRKVKFFSEMAEKVPEPLKTGLQTFGLVADPFGPKIAKLSIDAARNIDGWLEKNGWMLGKSTEVIRRIARERGPEAAAAAIYMTLKNDPTLPINHQTSFNSEQKKNELLAGGDPSYRNRPEEAGLEDEGYFDAVKPYKEAMLARSNMPGYAREAANFLIPDNPVDLLMMGKNLVSGVNRRNVYENAIKKPRDAKITTSGVPFSKRKVRVDGDVYTHEIYRKNGKIIHVLKDGTDSPVAEIEGSLMNYNGDKGFGISWSQSSTTGKGDGKRLYDLVLDTHGKVFSDRSLSPEGSHKVYADHFTKRPGVSVELADWNTPNRHVVSVDDSGQLRKDLKAGIVPKKAREFLNKMDPEVDEAVMSNAERAASMQQRDQRALATALERARQNHARGLPFNRLRDEVPESLQKQYDMALNKITSQTVQPDFLTAPIEKVDTHDLIKAAEGMTFRGNPEIQNAARNRLLNLMDQNAELKKEFMNWGSDRIAQDLDEGGFWRSVLKRGGMDKNQIRRAMKSSLGLNDIDIEDLAFAKSISQEHFAREVIRTVGMIAANSGRYWRDHDKRELEEQIMRAFE